jgi:hypothetical protein
MARIVILGLKGEAGLWSVDLDAGTATQIGSPTGGTLKAADDLRKAGATITSGVDLAALVPDGVGSLPEPSSGIYDK